MIVPSLQVVPKRDINPIEARQYSNRDTVYISPTGRDGYLGSTPDLPVKTVERARGLARKINTSVDKPRYIKFKEGNYNEGIKLEYKDSNIHTSPLYIEKLGSGKVSLEGSSYKTNNLSYTDYGLIRVEFPPITYQPWFHEGNMFIDDKRIFPARFPKEGSFNYRQAKKTGLDEFSIRDRTKFCETLIRYVNAVQAFPESSTYSSSEVMPPELWGNTILHFTALQDFTITEYTSVDSQFFTINKSDWSDLGVTIVSQPEARYYYPITEEFRDLMIESGYGAETFLIFEADVEYLFTDGSTYTPLTTEYYITASTDDSATYELNGSFKVVVTAQASQSYVWKSHEPVVDPFVPIFSYYRYFLSVAALRERFGEDYNLYIGEISVSTPAGEATRLTAGPRIAKGADFMGSVSFISISGIDINTNTNKYDISLTSSPGNVGVSIIPFGTNPFFNLSADAHVFCTQPGEFVISREQSNLYVYVRPYKENTTTFKLLTSTSGTTTGIYIDGAENVYIRDLNISNFYRGIQIQGHSRQSCITGCTIEKNDFGVQIEQAANVHLTKNTIFDHKGSGVSLNTVSACRIDNNIIRYSGLQHISQSGSGLENSGAPRGGGPSLTNEPLADATATTVGISVPYTGYYDPNSFIGVGDFDGYIEVKTGLFTGQRRLTTGFISSRADVGSRTYIYGIKDPWTPVNGVLHPQPGDLISYVKGRIANYSSKNIITNNHIKYAGYSVFHMSWSFLDTVSGNYLSNTGYGYSNDMGTLYYGFGGGLNETEKSVLHDNIALNCRQTPGLANGNTMYVEGQGRFADWYNNIADTGGSTLLSNEMCTTRLWNNIFINGKGTVMSDRQIQRTQFNYTSNNLHIIDDSPFYFGMSAYNNIWIATSGITQSLYPEYGYANNQTSMIAPASYMRPSRIIHTTTTQPLDEYRPIKYVSYDSKLVDEVSGWNGSFQFVRGGVSEGRPIYTRAENLNQFYVKDGNWVYGSTNTTQAPSVSTNCGINGYYYPWEVPKDAWFKRGFPDKKYYPDIQKGNALKRSVPFYSSNKNCYYTTLTGVTDTHLLSTTVNAFRADYNWSFKGLYDYANSSTYPLSAGFETLAPWEEGTLFADPKLDFSTYQVAEDSPVLDLGFKNIDVSKIGLREDGDPDWLSVPDTLVSHPVYGSADWSEFKYGNHNELRPNGIEFIPISEAYYTVFYEIPLTTLGLLDGNFYPTTYNPIPYYIENISTDKNNFSYIPFDYWTRNSVISSLERLTYYSDAYSNIFVYNGRDALSSINISNTTFTSVSFALPIENYIPWTAEELGGLEIQFLGTNNLNILNNVSLTSVDIKLAMFDNRRDLPEFYTRDINVLNNTQLSSVSIKANINDTSNANNSEAYTNITVSGCDVSSFALSAVDNQLYKTTSHITYITTLEDSAKLKNISFDSNISNIYITISAPNSFGSLGNVLSTAPDSYSTYIDYNSWSVLRGDAPFTQSTLSAYKVLDFYNLDSSNLVAILSTKSNYTSNLYNFTKAPSSTIVDVLTSQNSNLSWYFGDPIPVEIYFQQEQNFGIKNINVTTTPTNPNTLYSYQYNILIEPLSGIRQPYTFYRPVSALRKLNGDFGYNKNSTYTWPLSVLNSISRMTSYQGPFADSTMPRTLIHPRYAVTADHWSYAKTYPHTFSVFNATTQTQTTVTALTGKRVGSTDIRVIQLQTPLNANDFPGMYLVPLTLFKSNSGTKIPPVMPSFAFSQDYDLTLCPVSFHPSNKSTIVNGYFITDDTGGFLSRKSVRTGDSGHPVFTFINGKPVLTHTWATPVGGPSLCHYYDDVQAVVNELDLAAGGSGSVELNNITQEDLDVYDDYDNYIG